MSKLTLAAMLATLINATIDAYSHNWSGALAWFIVAGYQAKDLYGDYLNE